MTTPLPSAGSFIEKAKINHRQAKSLTLSWHIILFLLVRFSTKSATSYTRERTKYSKTPGDKLRRQSERTEKRHAFFKVFQTSGRKTREEKKNACFSLGLFKTLTAWFTGFVMSCDWLSAITRFQFYLSNSVLGAWVRLLFKVGKSVN